MEERSIMSVGFLLERGTIIRLGEEIEHEECVEVVARSVEGYHPD
jgi:hypothetical protein